jgi:hypothetical protein
MPLQFIRSRRELTFDFRTPKVVIPRRVRRAEKLNFPQRKGSTGMKKLRFTDSLIMDALKRVESGILLSDLCRD